MIQDILLEAEQRMQKCISALHTELAKLRTGRAHPSLLEHVRVNSYGSDVPLSQVASISASDARTLVVTPWDKSMIAAIEKAILTSDLGLNPASAGQVIRVPMPALTEQRRKELGKVVRDEGENTRVAIRNVRRDSNDQIKKLFKEKNITEDEVHRGEDSIQKLTDKLISEVDKFVATKETDLMEV